MFKCLREQRKHGLPVRLSNEVLQFLEPLAAFDGFKSRQLLRCEFTHGRQVIAVEFTGAFATLLSGGMVGLQSGCHDLPHNRKNMHAVRQRHMLVHHGVELFQRTLQFQGDLVPNAKLPYLGHVVEFSRKA